MKIRPLHEIDLARIATMPEAQQRKQLEQIRQGRPPFSYSPLRGCYHDIFNVQPEMFAPVSPTDWEVVQQNLAKKCKSGDELKSNLAVARGLHRFAIEAEVVGRAQEFFPLAMGSGRKVSYWLPMVLAFGGQPIIPFIDPRRSRRLSKEGRRFAFSMMHQRARVADPDYESVDLAIFQFGDFDDEIRSPIVYTDRGVTLFTLEQLDAMISTTYDLWREVCAERDAEARRTGTGARGSLL